MPFRLFICAAAFSSLALGVALCADLRPARTTPPGAASMTTREHLRASAWWPTKPANPSVSPGQTYVGSAACAKCHAEIAASQATSQMARTLVRAGASSVLHTHRDRQYHAGSYTWFLKQSGNEFAVHVSDGAQTRSAVLEWAFGSGDVGQSYFWQENGSFRESRFNFFSAFDGLAATPGRLHGTPLSVDMALGRPVENFEARTCFACHTTTMSATAPLDTATVVPGVSCEACHGPGAAHISAVEAHDNASRAAAADTSWDRAIVNPARMPPAQAVDLCGSCHSTPWDVRIMGAVGVQTVRFPAYRLEQSRCWGSAGDARLTCFSCHDPHAPLAREPAAYDSVCLDCHTTKASASGVAGNSRPPVAHVGIPARTTHSSIPSSDPHHPGQACPVANSNCVSCHMPKFELPEMHYKFTDHRIRVAHADAPFPD